MVLLSKDYIHAYELVKIISKLFLVPVFQDMTHHHNCGQSPSIPELASGSQHLCISRLQDHLRQCLQQNLLQIRCHF